MEEKPVLEFEKSQPQHQVGTMDEAFEMGVIQAMGSLQIEQAAARHRMPLISKPEVSDTLY